MEALCADEAEVFVDSEGGDVVYFCFEGDLERRWVSEWPRDVLTASS